MEFPALVYRSASSYLQVKDETEYWAALRDGWFATVPEALAPKLEIEGETVAEMQSFAREKLPPPDFEVTNNSFEPTVRQKLEMQAEALGIVVDGRWGDAKLAKKIAEAQAK